MPSVPVTLAKLSPPKLLGVIERERLFDLLDVHGQRAGIWIDGPPGAGKTTLVASYLQARGRPCIWYQVDAGDADPASFFDDLRHVPAAAREARRAAPAAPFPSTAAECTADLRGFTRRFFRAFFARLPGDAVFVLDNCHEAIGGERFDDIVCGLLEEAPPGVLVVMTSRSAPPAALARAQANGRLARVGWDALRLTPAETQAIVAAAPSFGRKLDAATLDRLAQQSAGWAAGLVLLLQESSRGHGLGPAAAAQTMETVFGYFAGQVFDDVPPSTRHLLLRTAFLPRVTAAAARALTGDDDAGALLAELHRRRLFTDRLEAADETYQYHALFREFLVDRVAAACPADERGRLRSRSAELLESSSDTADAVRLHVENGDWDAAIALILKRAGGLVAAGRWLTLESWIALLPADRVARTPWLTLWMGNALVLVAPVRARGLLELAFDRFVDARDAMGQALAATGIIECHNIECSAFTAMDPWLDALERLLGGGLAFSSARTHLRVHLALMLAAMHRRPGHPLLQACVQQGLAMLRADAPASVKADVATQLLQFFDFTGDLRSADALVAQATPLFAGDDLSALRRSGWLVFFSFHAALVGKRAEGLAALDRLRAIARESGIEWFGFFDLFFRSLLHLLGPTPLAAAPLMHPMGAVHQAGRPVETAQYQLARVLLYQVQREPSLAVYHGEICLDAVRRCGGALLNVLFPTVVAGAFVEAGQAGKALALVAQARAIGAGTPYRRHEALMLMSEAYAHAALDDAGPARALLAQAFVRAREDHAESLLRWLVLGFPAMLAAALKWDVEADAARSLIERFAVAAPSLDADAWPWPIRVYTLGRFSLVIAGAAQKPERKPQKRPLELLKYLVAQGGRDVNVEALQMTLWPDAEGGAAAEVFEVTLRRLRKLLGNDEAVELQNGRLALNTGSCWVDVWAFERGQGRAEALLAKAEPSADAAAIDALAEHVLSLYRGHFLPADDAPAWSVACRQRLASKFLRHVELVARHWQERDEPVRAETACRQALELDPLAESVHRQLMRLQMQQGHRAEALETYRRCSHALSAMLGVAPSAETQALHRRLVES